MSGRAQSPWMSGPRTLHCECNGDHEKHAPVRVANNDGKARTATAAQHIGRQCRRNPDRLSPCVFYVREFDPNPIDGFPLAGLAIAGIEEVARHGTSTGM